MPSRRKFLTTLLLVAVTITAGFGAFLQQPDDSELLASLPEGEGRTLLGSRCTVCHGLSTTLIGKMYRQDWERTLDLMVSRGAQIQGQERATLLDYLVEHYGITQGSADTEGGQNLLAQKCFQCHGDGMWKGMRADRRGWEAVLYRMIGKGALWTEEEVNLMADYLSQIQPSDPSNSEVGR